jgi:pimeloyl-ACP methyl ester carboxylesterase
VCPAQATEESIVDTDLAGARATVAAASGDPFRWPGGDRVRSLARPDGTVLHVTEAGTGTPIVLVHGFGMSQACWGFVGPALARAGHRVIAYDHRGHGR